MCENVEYFVYKLIAPRPTLAQDITAAETELLKIHAKYWSDLADRGIAVLFGPVLDPKGAWGLAVVETNDEAEANRLGVNDPAIKADVGFRFEVYPMPQAILRK